MNRSAVPYYPFDPDRYIGSVIQVRATTVRCNLPRAAANQARHLHGHRVPAGEVGEFVVIECGDSGVFGRITEVILPERDRLAVERYNDGNEDVYPVGTVELLSSFSISAREVYGGITEYPRIGAYIYSAHPLFIKWLTENADRSSADKVVTLHLAEITHAGSTPVTLTPERLFGRHCAIVGTTGGGKSWSVARIISECSRYNAKVILFDATGEFHTLSGPVQHLYLGSGPPEPECAEKVMFPHRYLHEQDLFAIFRPSGQVQVPRLRAAIRSLKLARLLGNDHDLVQDGCIVKAEQLRAPFDTLMRQHHGQVSSPTADFDIHKLVEQIQHECVWPTARDGNRRDYLRWGQANDGDIAYCNTLIARVEDYVSSDEFSVIFGSEAAKDLIEGIEEFVASDQRVLRVSMKYVPFKSNVREILANAIGRVLLERARQGNFRNKPLVVILDEAHQFLSRVVGDEFSQFVLDSFELIAKEGRKYGISLVLATQRPRDLPDAVLSQMGTFIVHRLIAERDITVVERASSELNHSVTAFLPALGPGQAVIVGVDFPIPLQVHVLKPPDEPDSSGPDYQRAWYVE